MSGIKNLFNSTLFKAALFFCFGAWALYLGRYHTLYGLGATLVFAVFVFALLIGVISAFIFKSNGAARGLKVSLNIGAPIFIFFVVAYYVDNYKPTLKIIAPANFEGCVYLFYTKDEVDDVVIDSNGIGYIEFGKKAIYDFYIGNKKNNEVLKTGGFNLAMTYNEDSTWTTSVRVNCYHINSENIYPKDYPYVHTNCMDWEEFFEMLQLGLVDTNKFEIYRRKLEPMELLQRKRSREFRVFWPTNLQTGEVGDLRGRAISQKIYAYFKFKYDTVSPKVFKNETSFSQQFVKGINYAQENYGDSSLRVTVRLPKTNLKYTKKAFSTFFLQPDYQFNLDSSLYNIPLPINKKHKKFQYKVEAKKDSVFVEIVEPTFLQ